MSDVILRRGFAIGIGLFQFYLTESDCSCSCFRASPYVFDPQRSQTQTTRLLALVLKMFPICLGR